MERTVEVKYIEYWVVRVIHDIGSSKVVKDEFKFPTPPTEQDIVEILLKYNEDYFVTVSHNYKLA